MFSLFNLANVFKKVIVSSTLIIFLLSFFKIFVEITQPALFLIASLINLFPLFFFPLIAQNKLSFFIVLVSIERPLKFTDFFLPKAFSRISLF